MFQANYHYTPLKEYAATRSTRPINETTPSNGYQRKSIQREREREAIDVGDNALIADMRVKETVMMSSAQQRKKG